MGDSRKDGGAGRVVALVVALNWIGFVVTVLFWGLLAVSHRVPYPWELTDVSARGASATTYGFLLGDLVFSAPLLFAAARGLGQRRAYGFIAAMMANALWAYSMTVVLLRDAFTVWSPGALLFTPFAVAALGTMPLLWRHRTALGIGGAASAGGCLCPRPTP